MTVFAESEDDLQKTGILYDLSVFMIKHREILFSCKHLVIAANFLSPMTIHSVEWEVWVIG